MINKTPKRFLRRKNYVVKKISDFPIRESDGSEILLIEVAGKLYQMQLVNTGSTSFSIEYVSELPETGSLNVIYIVNNTTGYIWDDVNSIFYSLSKNYDHLIPLIYAGL